MTAQTFVLNVKGVQWTEHHLRFFTGFGVFAKSRRGTRTEAEQHLFSNILKTSEKFTIQTCSVPELLNITLKVTLSLYKIPKTLNSGLGRSIYRCETSI